MTGPTNTQPIESEVREFIATQLLYAPEGFTFSDEASLLREGIVDSMGITELVAFVQSRFAIEVDPQDVIPENFDSVKNLAAYVRRKLGVPESPANPATETVAPPASVNPAKSIPSNPPLPPTVLPAQAFVRG
jgi:acyl carrier protein